MCGRFQFVPKGNSPWVDDFGLPDETEFSSRINLAPTQDAPVVLNGSSGRSLQAMRWGLIPCWSSQAESLKSFINARIETASVKPSFRDAWRARRCLILSTGYYEWERKGGPPTLVQRADCGLISFAGLWEPNLQNATSGIPSCTILTTSAAPAIEDLHSRMPVMLPLEQHETWLRNGDPGFLPQGMQDLPYGLSTRLVSRRLNKVEHDDISCLKPDPQDAPPPPGLFD